MAFRLDYAGSLRKPHRTGEGFLYADGFATRTGVLEYVNPDGSIRREYRSPEEVGRADSLGSLARKPVTLGHPREMVTPENAHQYQQGTVGEEVTFVADGFAKVTLAVHRKDAISAVDRGTRELSSAYECDIDDTPGVTPDGERYDCSQKNIRYNHLAIVERGRAGSRVRLRADGDAVDFEESDMPQDNPARQDATPNQPAPVVAPTATPVSPAPVAPTAPPIAATPALPAFIEVNGQRYDAAAITALKAKTDELQGELDALNRAQTQERQDAAQLAFFNERNGLLELARAYNIDEADKQTNPVLSRAIAKAYDPDLSPDASADTVRGVLRGARKDIANRTTHLDTLAKAVGNPKAQKTFDQAMADAAKADDARYDAARSAGRE